MRFPRAPVLWFLMLFSAAAMADPRMVYLTRQLNQAKDPRLKAQAALMLGNSNDSAALEPLCQAVTDASEVVRTASAKALGQLGDLGAIDCLKPLKADADPVARAAILASLTALEAIAHRTPDLYIALSPVANKADVGPDVLQLAEDRLRAKLRMTGALLAPKDEAKKLALRVIKQKKLRGYWLVPELHSLPGGGIKFHVLCFTYPDKALLGEVNVKASGAGPSDLIRALAPKVIDEAADTFDWRQSQ